MNDSTAASTPAARTRRLWPWILLGALMLLSVVTVALAALVVHSLGSLGLEGWRVVIDGQPWRGVEIDSEKVWVAAVVIVALGLAALLVVPLLILGVLLCAVLGVAAALLVALLAVLVATSPIWLIAAALWFALRPRKNAAAVNAAPGSTNG